MNEMNLERFTNEDYQNRKGNYPKSNIPVSIEAGNDFLEFSFKNTDEATGVKWVQRFCSNHNLETVGIKAFQDGDYQNDWIIVKAEFGE